MTDCQRVYNAMRDHYKEHVHQPITVADLAREARSQITLERVIFALTMLTRESGANIVVTAPINPDSKVSGNHDLLASSFVKRVKERRALLQRQRKEMVDGTVANAFPGLSLVDRVYGASPPSALTSASFFSALDDGSDEVRDAWHKCLERGRGDPDGAITTARSLFESACKQVLGHRGISYPEGTALPELHARVRKELALDPSKAANAALRTVFQGCVSVVQGLAELRNALGDSHGKPPGSPRASHRHAKLACALAGAMAAYLLATDEGRKISAEI